MYIYATLEDSIESRAYICAPIYRRFSLDAPSALRRLRDFAFTYVVPGLPRSFRNGKSRGSCLDLWCEDYTGVEIAEP